jgi:hypothetical protein
MACYFQLNSKGLTGEVVVQKVAVKLCGPVVFS